MPRLVRPQSASIRQAARFSGLAVRQAKQGGSGCVHASENLATARMLTRYYDEHAQNVANQIIGRAHARVHDLCFRHHARVFSLSK